MSLVAGCLFMIVGIVSLYYAIKAPIKDDEVFLNSTNFKWIGFSISSILIGLYLIFE